MIHRVDRRDDFLSGHGIEPPRFGEVLAQPAIRIFVEPALPTVIRPCQESLAGQRLSNVSMATEFSAIVIRDRRHPVFPGFEKGDDCLRDQLGGFAKDGDRQDQARAAFGERHDRPLVGLPHYQVNFPVPLTGPSFHESGTLLNPHPTGEGPSSILGSLTFSIGLGLMTEVARELAPLLLVLEDESIDGFGTQETGLFPLEPSTNLFWAPPGVEFLLDKTPPPAP